MTINKVVIPAAGMGTRLLSATKEAPKEMLPIFARGKNGELSVKPLLEVIFEQIRAYGPTEFCIVVGREKRAIVDHFTQDSAFLERLEKRGKLQQAKGLRSFYDAIDSSSLTWVTQPEPLGFGHSLLMAAGFVGKDHFLVHAGDTYIVSTKQSFLNRMVRAHEGGGAQATILLMRVPPTKGYGFATVEGKGNVVRVKSVIEKPERPPSNLAIMPVYVLGSEIMEELRRVKPGVGGEIQLTDGIARLIEKGYRVQGVLMQRNEVRLDIGTPELYWEALRVSKRDFAKIG